MRLIAGEGSKVVDCARGQKVATAADCAAWFVVNGALVVECEHHDSGIIINRAIVVKTAVHHYCSTVINRAIVVEDACDSNFAKNIERTIINNDRAAMCIHVKTAASG